MVSHTEPTTTSPREERRRIRMEMTRSQVLDAAEGAFASTGFHTTTIKSIAEQCEIAVGTIYVLFDDKESIYEAVLRRRGDALTVLTTAKAAEPGPGDTRLVELAELQLRFFRDYPDWSRIAAALVSDTRAVPASVGSSNFYAGGHQVVADVIAGVIASGQQSGHLRDGDPHTLALIYLGMLRTFHSIDSAAHMQPSDNGLTDFLELLHAAFRAPNRRTGRA